MMEKLSQIKTKIFNFKFLLQQPVASFSIHNPALSPNRSPAHNVSIIPKEARRSKDKGGNFTAKEPSSPKVSCMGQVQGKKKKRKTQKRVQHQHPVKNNDPVPEKKKILLLISKGTDDGRKLCEKAPPTIEAPSLGAMKKFVSGRGSDLTLAER